MHGMYGCGWRAEMSVFRLDFFLIIFYLVR